MKQQDVNAYNAESWRREFTGIDGPCLDIKRIWNDLHWDYHYDRTYRWGGSPRQRLADHSIWPPEVFSMVPFYYLKHLTEINPDKIWDLGCGWNIFKKFIPNIHGVDIKDPQSKYFFADEQADVNSQWMKDHQGQMQAVFSICAWHFFPLGELREKFQEFAGLLAPGGRGFLAMNLARMLELDQDAFKDFSVTDLEDYVRTQMYQEHYRVLVFDLDFSKIDDGLDGNIRIVLENPKS